MLIRSSLRRLIYLFQITSYSRRYFRNDTTLKNKFLEYSKRSDAVALDIGSGPFPKNPFDAETILGVDFRENIEKKVKYADLSKGNLPFDNESCDFATAFDLLEHIPRVSNNDNETTFPLILLMNEIFRVLKKDGIFFCSQPVFPAKAAFQDPTHINIMSEDTMDYYFCEKAWARIYGYSGSFKLLNDGWLGEKYFCFMRKVGSNPVYDINFKQK